MARWCDINECPDYLVSDEGRVYSKKRNIYLKPRRHCNGYLAYCLSVNGKHLYFLAHRLVANAFLENPMSLPEVNHKDENKQNNSAENLEWCTRQHNVNHGTAKQRSAETQGIAIYQLTSDGDIVKKWPSIREAARNGFDFRHIQGRLSGKNKTHKGYVWRYADAS